MPFLSILNTARLCQIQDNHIPTQGVSQGSVETKTFLWITYRHLLHVIANSEIPREGYSPIVRNRRLTRRRQPRGRQGSVSQQGCYRQPRVMPRQNGEHWPTLRY